MPGSPEIEIFRQPDGTWAVDWRLVGAILRANANFSAILEYGRESPPSQWHWYDAFLLETPDVVTFEVDWEAQRRARDLGFRQLMAEAALVPVRQGCRTLRDSFLRQRIAQTEEMRETFQDTLKRATAQTLHNAEQAVADYDMPISLLRGIRDFSADFVLVGATVLTGGEALLAAGAGSTMRGIYSYQDKQNIGLAMVETTTSFLMTTISIARTAAVAAGAEQTGLNAAVEDAVVVLIGAQFDVAKGLIEGKTLDVSMSEASVNAAGGALLGKLLEARKLKALIDRIALPAQFRISSDEAKKLKDGVLEKITDRQILSRIANLAGDALEPDKRKQIATDVQQRGGMCLAGEISAAGQDALDHAVRKLD